MLKARVCAVAVASMLAALSHPLAQTAEPGGSQTAKGAMSDEALISWHQPAPADIGAKATVVDHGKDGKARADRPASEERREVKLPPPTGS